MAAGQLILMDGAMGTLLLRQGLPPGSRLELLSLTQPERITAIHRQYVEAGARLLYANTFCANRLRLEGSGHSAEEVITGAVACARAALTGYEGAVAMTAGPCGRGLTPAEYRLIHGETARAGARAGADCIVFETMVSLEEARMALLAAREQCGLPVLVTFHLRPEGRTPAGDDIREIGPALEAWGADGVGINCSLGPDRMLPAFRALAGSTSLPLILKLSAGLPHPQTGAYPLSPEEYCRRLAPFVRLGASCLGGCCGTTPAYIKALAEAYQGRAVKGRAFPLF